MLEKSRISRWLVCLAVIGMAVGCGDTSPVTPDRQDLTFIGEIASQESVSHHLALVRGGTIRVELVDLTPIFLDISDLPLGQTLEESLGIGVGIGEFDEEGVCLLELRPTLTVGRVVTVLVSDGINCLSVFDPGQLPPDSIIGYTVVVTDAAG